MLPSIIAEQVRRCIEDFLQTTFSPEEPFFEGIFQNLFKEPKALFRGPYFSLKLPFCPGVGINEELYPEIPMPFPPYLHQENVFERLSAEPPLPTLVATGTGSGKTECFMYPILDYCWKHRREPGVKAIIIYPMNALADDQMKRFAREIFNNPNLRGNVSAGLFIGGQDDNKGETGMSENSVITCRDTMRTNPPDILLTNYKMLDYMLIRSKDYALWQNNTPQTLKYLVVDELHTFDGAQGTDLACLIRRLMFRLNRNPQSKQITPPCFVGTSATLGADKVNQEKLLKFASNLFGADFDSDSIITEKLLQPDEFFETPQYGLCPRESDYEVLRADNSANEYEYLRKQVKLWLDEDSILPADENDLTEEHRVTLGDKLKNHLFFQNLIKFITSHGVMDISELSKSLCTYHPGFSGKSESFQTVYIDSLFALISFARQKKTTNNSNVVIVPFLNVQIQLWLRELRRIVATVENSPRLRYYNDLRPGKDEPVKTLPLVYCRSCGRMGYLSVQRSGDKAFSDNLDVIYNNYFNTHGPTIHFIYRDYTDGGSTVPENANPSGGQTLLHTRLCGHCLTTLDNPEDEICPACGEKENLVPIQFFNPRVTNANNTKHVYNNCPHCKERDSLTIVGSRSASLISVAISQLFASRYNDDRKVLAFSDSVQDASHRAGFFEARTYRFNLRAAIQQMIEQSGKNYTLANLPTEFFDYWAHRIGGLEKFIVQFIPVELQYLKEYETLIQTGKLSNLTEFYNIVCKRLKWEIQAEYSYNALIGRTLEKSGASIPRLNVEKRNAWVNQVLSELQEKFNFRYLDKTMVTRFLLGIVRLLRVRGGLYNDAFQDYLRSGDLFQLNRETIFLPDFYHSSPVFASYGRNRDRFDGLIGSGSSYTNYQNWQKQVLKSANGIKDVLPMVFNSAVSLGIFHMEEMSDAFSYSLNPDVMEIELDVDSYICNESHQHITAPRSEKEFWDGMPSFRFYCPEGKYQLHNSTEYNYYQKLYKDGYIHRVIAREHTGLLERDFRERLENDFISGEKLASPNILSCTSTLEMGINIGNLSTVILCSVPPTSANYVQRVGRSGRKDGNSFSFVVATGKPHDLHFFSDPREMLAGEVTPPGVFLNAPAVLERQLTAFCFDRWIESLHGSKKTPVPPDIKKILQTVQKEKVDDQCFPYNLIRFITDHAEELYQDFCGIFGSVFTERTKLYLKDYIINGERQDGLSFKIINRFLDLVKLKTAYSARLQYITRQIKGLREKKVLDAANTRLLEDLYYEKSVLMERSIKIQKGNTYNFFTDEGLLPNYAFPQAGVKLLTNIYSSKIENDSVKYSVETGEYERIGQRAIYELAPGNKFYVNGRKLTINQINMANTQIERWRFCGECFHVEKLGEDESHHKTCPVCGSASWAEKSMVRNVVALKEAISTISDKESHSFDETEERVPMFYNQFLLPEFSREYIDSAWKTNDECFPFGFEYHRKATFREVNFGLKEFIEGDVIDVGGEKVSTRGFRVCRDCGMVESLDGKEPFKHHITCKHYRTKSEKNVIECLYLYREFTSEAVRILLPIDSIDSSKTHSLMAAFYMGLEEYFNGDVNHLGITFYKQPEPGSCIRKSYMVLYDQIPGGSGYLKELTENETVFMSMIQKAYDKINQCECQNDPDKDGCYRCLYGYRVSRDIPHISRKDALEVLHEILDHKSFKKTETVDTIPVNSLLESELEKRFLEALRKSRYQGSPLDLKKEMCNGKPGYLLTMMNIRNEEVTYQIQPQVSVGSSNGVSVCSRVDFLIEPLRKSGKTRKPIAVFTDGYKYHGNPLSTTNDYRFPLDLIQRMALVKSGRYYCWSITYDDVQVKKDKSNDKKWKSFKYNGSVAGKLIPVDAHVSNIFDGNSIDNLIAFLGCYGVELNSNIMAENLFIDAAKNYAIDLGAAHRLTVADIQKMESELLTDKVMPAFDSREDSSIMNDYVFSGNIRFGDFQVQTFSCLLRQSVVKKDFNPSEIIIRIDDSLSEEHRALINASRETAKGKNVDVHLKTEISEQIQRLANVFQKLWASVLHAYNLLQFLPQTVIVTSQMIEMGSMIPEMSLSYEDEQWKEIMEYSDPTVAPLLNWAKNEQWDVPVAGYEFENELGTVCGIAELAWTDKKIAVLLSEEGKVFCEQSGWKTVIVNSGTIDDNIEQLSIMYKE